MTTFIVAAQGSTEQSSPGLQEIGYWNKGGGRHNAVGKLIWDFGEAGKPFVHITSEGTESLESATVRYRTDFHNRNQGIMDPSVLQEKEVTIFGLGSVGAKLALDLTRAGVGRLTLIDPDRVSVSNLCRCEYDLFDLGRSKTEALTARMLAINPKMRIACHDEDLLQMSSALEDVICRSHLVVGATDNPGAQRVINSTAYHHVPSLYPGVYPQGMGGEIIITIPGETACMECVLKNILSQSLSPKRGTWDYATEGQLKPEAALIADIQNIVTNTTKLALALLSRGEDGSKLSSFINPKHNVLFICNEVEEDWLFEYPFQTIWASSEVNEDCWCRTLA
ncbi:MAG: ThiF family adenylyltransferase [Deltaproteobacteria bacterium]|nr:ThiF family adenylyltransferase [Deltaproteobacteria bacterium]